METVVALWIAMFKTGGLVKVRGGGRTLGSTWEEGMEQTSHVKGLLGSSTTRRVWLGV